MRKLYFYIFMIFILMLLFVQGCEYQSPFSPTPAPTNTITSTPVCPTEVFSISTTLAVEPKLVVVLFENSPQYRSYTLQGIEVMNTVLGESFNLGDHLIMLTMEPITLEDAAFVNVKVGNSPSPVLPPMPTHFPTATPALPLVSTPGTRFGQMAATQDAVATASSVIATATHSAYLYDCAYTAWNEQYSLAQKKYQDEQKKIINDFINQVVDEENQFLESEPIARAGVWNGLARATTIFENECNKYTDCFLIVFSDMNEVMMSQPSQLDINLRGAKFLGVMSHCEFLYSGECARWREFWQQNLDAVSVDFINENVLETIAAFLR